MASLARVGCKPALSQVPRQRTDDAERQLVTLRQAAAAADQGRAAYRRTHRGVSLNEREPRGSGQMEGAFAFSTPYSKIRFLETSTLCTPWIRLLRSQPSRRAGSWSAFCKAASEAGLSDADATLVSRVVVVASFLAVRAYARVASLLCLEEESLQRAMTHRRTRVGDEVYWAACTPEEEAARCCALAMGLYQGMFNATVTSVNNKNAGVESPTHLNILDIFGFEAFRANGLDQLCINYCNERLQCMFAAEVVLAEAEYLRQEGLPTEHPSLPALDCITSLCEQVIFPILDEALVRKATPESIVLEMDAREARRPTHCLQPPEGATLRSRPLCRSSRVRHAFLVAATPIRSDQSRSLCGVSRSSCGKFAMAASFSRVATSSAVTTFAKAWTRAYPLDSTETSSLAASSQTRRLAVDEPLVNSRLLQQA